MTRVTKASVTIERAQRRAANERRRADLDGVAAARHERLAASGPEWLRQFHRDVAFAHRQLEALHLVTAGIQSSHVTRLLSWAESVNQESASPGHRAAIGEAVVREGGDWPESGFDALTGLPRRNHFIERLSDAIGWLDDPEQHAGKEERRVGMCHIGLDGFKTVNDQFGHEVGDALLSSVAERLAERIPGHLLARLTSDEFAILLRDTSGADDATKVAHAALTAIHEPFHIDGHELTISASVGVVERPIAGADPTEVMRAANMTLTWAKGGGRGRWALFDPERDQREKARYELTAALPAAVARGELFVEYQPIVSLRDEKIVAAEALVRWRHPVLGVLYPDAFIDLAERSDMITSVGGFVLSRACSDAGGWGRFTPEPPSVSVNVSARQLRDTDLRAEVATALEQSGLPADHLQLEITESEIVQPDDQSLSTLHELVKLGVRVAVDDFGTGYSNLAYFRRLPVQVVKIDQSFVSEVGRPGREDECADVQILAAMVSLGHVLGLTVTAEGVETATQAVLLRSIACDSAQGWHFGRPVGPDEFAALLAGQAS